MSSINALNSTQNLIIASKPKIPYFGTLTALSGGSLIIIYGRVPFGAKRFAINLMVGSVITQTLREGNGGDVAFHFNPRFDDGVVVRNSYQNMIWGPEERQPTVNPFSGGQDFEAMILCEDHSYKVAVNGRHFIEFVHRIPLSCVGVLNINGSVEIDRIEYRREMRYIPTINPMPVINSNSAHILHPILSPPLPYHQKFTEGLREGFMVYISGRLNQSPDRFAIDMLSTTVSNSDVAFHLNVRIRESVVVRNTYQHNKWEEEERQIPNFPFYAGVNFDLIIRVESNRYMIAVNGQHFIEYKHRIPPKFVNGLSISGDVVIASIRFSQT